MGRMHFMVYLGKHPAAEIELIDKEIIIDIKNPVTALALGGEERRVFGEDPELRR